MWQRKRRKGSPLPLTTARMAPIPRSFWTDLRNGGKGELFVIGKEAEEHPELILRMYKEGHLIGNHTYHHVELTRVDMETEKEEIKRQTK